LLHWFDANKRDLPWRRNRDPYRVWVAEVMLQQTRVAAVLEHYQDFLRKFPTLRSLARAREEQVLAAWSGLGYYRRAHALHTAARQIKGKAFQFPTAAEQWRELPGIGRYTAAAIASIAFDERRAVVDGNVERVLARLFRAKKRNVWAVAEKLLSPDRPGDFNQAVMELGATVCLPQNPVCERCPVWRWCRTRGATDPPASPARGKRQIAYQLARRNGRVLLIQRPATSRLMPGMWELPELRDGGAPDGLRPMLRLRHSITITDYRVEVYATYCDLTSGRWVPAARLSSLPLTGLTRKIFRRLELI
jgi:A/G-specific adenine glycosylase